MSIIQFDGSIGTAFCLGFDRYCGADRCPWDSLCVACMVRRSDAQTAERRAAEVLRPDWFASEEPMR